MSKVPNREAANLRDTRESLKSEPSLTPAMNGESSSSSSSQAEESAGTYAGDDGGFDASDEVTREAYELYRQRGYIDGHDVDDWYEAERRVRQRRDATGDGADRSSR
jgi:hypothetical protein